MNDTDMETLEQWQESRVLSAAMIASFNVTCDMTLRCFEREVDNLTDQVKKELGVRHLRENWPRFKAAYKKLQDIYMDMDITQKPERT